jgi:CheY-specific phosphatase CheX
VETERIAEVLGDAANTILETMFFTMAEGYTEPLFAPDTPVLHAALSFSGAWSGTFELKAPFDSARAITQSFVGAMDPEEVPDERVGEVICELANMVCGSTLSQLGDDKIFHLGTPYLVGPEDGASLQRGPGTSDTAVRALDLGSDGLLALSLTIEAYA